jgi:hypothetical protein
LGIILRCSRQQHIFTVSGLQIWAGQYRATLSRVEPVAWHTHITGLSIKSTTPEALNMLRGCIGSGRGMGDPIAADYTNFYFSTTFVSAATYI